MLPVIVYLLSSTQRFLCHSIYPVNSACSANVRHPPDRCGLTRYTESCPFVVSAKKPILPIRTLVERTQSEPRPHRHGPNADDDGPPRPSFRDIAQKFLQGEMFLPENAARRMDDQVAEFREKFVNQNSRRTRDAEREPVPPSPIQPIYVRKLKRGPLSVLAPELRYLLSEQCVRGLSFYGMPHVRSSVWHLRRNLMFHLSS